MKPLTISRRRRTLEILAILAVVIGRLYFMVELGWRLPFILVVGLGWIGYVWYRTRAEPRLVNYWGLTTDNFRASFLLLLPVALVCVLLFFAYGFYFGTQVVDWSLLLILLLYPLWGAVQQFLALGIFARNLEDGWQRPEWQVVLLTGGLFGLNHYPFPLLMAATFLLGLAYSWLYLRGFNLLALGIYHGWLGGVFFYTVLGRNSFAEIGG